MAQCFNLTADQLAEKLAAGWTIASGPHATEAACTAVCGVSSSASATPSSSSVSPISSLSSQGTTVEITCGACSPGTTAPRQFAVTFSGITDGTCINCNNLNATHILTYTNNPVNGNPAPDKCYWQSPAVDTCTGETDTPLYVTLLYTGGVWSLFITSPLAGLVTWAQLAFTNCETAIEFYNQTGGGTCVYPDTPIAIPI